MKLSREDIVLAAEAAELSEDDYSIRYSYTSSRHGEVGGGVDITGDTSETVRFVMALSAQLAEDGRSDDALTLGRLTRIEAMGFGVAVHWPCVEITA